MLSKVEQLFIGSRCAKKANHIQNAVKLLESFHRSNSSQIPWVDKLMDIELDSMNLLQAELRVTKTVQHLEKLKKLNGNLTDEEEKYLQDSQKELQKYDIRWWTNTQLYYQFLFLKPKGYYVRQLDLLRNGYFPLTEEQVQSACKAIGGCCAFECGCCYRDRGSSRMPGALMHCMKECPCCCERREGRYIISYAGKLNQACRLLLVDYWHRNGTRK
jgi:hypothetical protein